MAVNSFNIYNHSSVLSIGKRTQVNGLILFIVGSNACLLSAVDL